MQTPLHYTFMHAFRICERVRYGKWRLYVLQVDWYPKEAATDTEQEMYRQRT